MKPMPQRDLIPGLLLSLTAGQASALTPPASPGGVADASLPAALSILIWGPVLALTLACFLALLWLLREPGTKTRQAADQALPQPRHRAEPKRRRVQRVLPPARPRRTPVGRRPAPA